MSSSDADSQRLRQLVADTVRSPEFYRATFGGQLRGPAVVPWLRVVVRPVQLRGQRFWQFSYFDRKKNITRNFAACEIESPLDEILAAGFAGIHLATAREEVDIRLSKKGKVAIGRRKLGATAPPPAPGHNRVKDLLLPEGKSDRLLEVMGVMTRDGHVRPAMRAKFTQINEFLKHLSHVLDDAGLRLLGRNVSILDCGCGASYLTLAVHHYLQDVLGIPAEVLGVDVSEEVIRKSMQRGEQAGIERVRFACSRIDAVAERADIVLALHACDTATDDAIALAIRGEARLLLCVPCCHHHLNDQLRPDGPAAVLRPLLRHGILHERAADLVTDAFRALALRIMGYRTDVVEFISPEHTTRNLMIRAVRGLPAGDPAMVREYVSMRHFWGVKPYIEQALGEIFQRHLAPAVLNS